MLDLKFVRENPEIVKQNIKNKFQDSKLGLVDEVIELDAKNRAAKKEADDLRANKNKIAKQIGALMGQGKKDEAEEMKKQVAEQSARLAALEEQEKELLLDVYVRGLKRELVLRHQGDIVESTLNRRLRRACLHLAALLHLQVLKECS